MFVNVKRLMHLSFILMVIGTQTTDHTGESVPKG